MNERSSLNQIHNISKDTRLSTKLDVELLILDLLKIDKNILSVGLDESKLTNSNPDLYSRREFGYESFNRTFNLPEIVDTNKIDANYEDGILKIKLNKKKTDIVRTKKVIKVM